MNNLLFQINNEGYTNFKNASRLQYSTLWSHTKDLHCQEGLYLHVTDWQLSISTWIWVGVTLMAIQLSFYSYISSKANSLIRKVGSTFLIGAWNENWDIIRRTAAFLFFLIGTSHCACRLPTFFIKSEMANPTQDFQESRFFPTFCCYIVPEESRKSEKPTSENCPKVTGLTGLKPGAPEPTFGPLVSF